jgi:hypothetical protein
MLAASAGSGDERSTSDERPDRERLAMRFEVFRDAA